MKCPYCKYELKYHDKTNQWCCVLGIHKPNEKYKFNNEELKVTMKLLQKTIEINFN